MKNEIVKQILAKRKNVRVTITLYADKDNNSVFLIQTKRLLEKRKITNHDFYLRPETFLMLEELLPLFLETDNVAKMEVLDALAEAKATESELYRYQNPKIYK